MRAHPAVWILGCLLAAAPAAAAASFAEPLADDADASGATLVPLPGGLMVHDRVANGVPSPGADETLYLDVDGDRVVSWGDLRVSDDGGYDAGTRVDTTNRDYGAPLLPAPGPIATEGDGDWLVDMDRSRTASPGDVWLTGPSAGAALRAGDDGVGGPLTDPATGAGSPSFAFWDLDNDGVPSWYEPAFLDLDADRRADAGELTFTGNRFGDDNAATRSDLAALETRVFVLQLLVVLEALALVALVLYLRATRTAGPPRVRTA
ncbi:MAG: hypothetical protein ACT4PT_06055 [Methanobacteriota archaeon]